MAEPSAAHWEGRSEKVIKGRRDEVEEVTCCFSSQQAVVVPLVIDDIVLGPDFDA